MNSEVRKTNEQKLQSLEQQIHELRQKLPTSENKINPSPRKKMGIFLIIFLSVLLFYWGFTSGLKGKLTAKSNALGDWTISADDCRSGAAYIPQFWGVVIRGSNKEGPRLEIQGDSSQNAKILIWKSAAETPITIDSTQCRKKEIKIEQNGFTVNEFVSVKGYIKLDCDLRGGGQFLSEVEFRNCH